MAKNFINYSGVRFDDASGEFIIDFNEGFPDDIINFSAGNYEINQAKFKGKSYYFGYKLNVDSSPKDIK